MKRILALTLAAFLCGCGKAPEPRPQAPPETASETPPPPKATPVQDAPKTTPIPIQPLTSMPMMPQTPPIPTPISTPAVSATATPSPTPPEDSGTIPGETGAGS